MKIIRAFKSYRFKKKTSRWTDEEIDQNIHIQSTTWDRKKVLSDANLVRIRKMLKKGAKLQEIAREYGVDPRTIRYAVDANYRMKRIAQSNGKHYGGTERGTRSSRIAYKKQLIAEGLIVE